MHLLVSKAPAHTVAGGNLLRGSADIGTDRYEDSLSASVVWYHFRPLVPDTTIKTDGCSGLWFQRVAATARVTVVHHGASHVPAHSFLEI